VDKYIKTALWAASWNDLYKTDHYYWGRVRGRKGWGREGRVRGLLGGWIQSKHEVYTYGNLTVKPVLYKAIL
jgi:hypothetical protein